VTKDEELIVRWARVPQEPPTPDEPPAAIAEAVA
jgi:hypothetical protein